MGDVDGTIVLLHWSIQMLFSFLQSESGAKQRHFASCLENTKLQFYPFLFNLSVLTEFAESGSALWLVAGPAVAVGIRMMISEQMLPKHRLM